MAFSVLPLIFLLLQGPGEGINVLSTQPREIKRLYWELFETTEVWIRIVPECPTQKTPMLDLIFQAYFPGVAEREPYSLLPQKPKGLPGRLTLRAQSYPTTVTQEFSFWISLEGKKFDLLGPDSRYTAIGCGIGEGCSPRAVSIELRPSFFRSIISAQTVDGEVLGVKIKLAGADLAALKAFANQVGISEPKSSGEKELGSQSR